VGDGQRQGIGGVGGARRRVQPEDLGHEFGDGVLVGGAASRDGGFDLRRRVQRHRDAAARGRGNDHTGGLRHPHDGADVELGKDPFHGQDVRLVLVQPLVDGCGNDEQPLVQALLR
jgi:hypothetical protein